MMDLAFNFEEEKTMPAEAAAEGPQPKTVTELSNEIKRFVEGNFGRVLVRGEIFGDKRADSGHWYLSLKDENSVLSAVCWRGVASGLKVKIEDGLEVIASGKITTFSGKSSYQLVIESLEPAGQGALLKLLEERKQQFIKEGLFDTAHKKPIPFLPRTIGVVSSASGAVIRDIIHRIRDRFPSHIVLWPTPVQGEGAAEKVAAAIRGFNALDGNDSVRRPDVIIVARGGGSLEDLWPFNEEVVIRAVYDSEIPLISAVGHETDTMLIDYAADKRAPTPTGAAEFAVPVKDELVSGLNILDLSLIHILVTDSRYVTPTAVSMYSAIKNKCPQSTYNFYVVAEEITRRDENMLLNLQKLAPGTVHVKIIPQQELDLPYENMQRFMQYKVGMHKIFLPDTLKELDKVIYMDGDTLVLKDLRELFDIDVSTFYAAVAKDGIFYRFPKEDVYKRQVLLPKLKPTEL